MTPGGSDLESSARRLLTTHDAHIGTGALIWIWGRAWLHTGATRDDVATRRRCNGHRQALDPVDGATGESGFMRSLGGHDAALGATSGNDPRSE
jgi:hypothetical protein